MTAKKASLGRLLEKNEKIKKTVKQEADMTRLAKTLVHGIAEAFLEHFKAAVNGLSFGMPWQKGVFLTPVPEKGKTGENKKMTTRIVQDHKSKFLAMDFIL